MPDFWKEDREGDSLYRQSIVALDSRTGALQCHYQQYRRHPRLELDAGHFALHFDQR